MRQSRTYDQARLKRWALGQESLKRAKSMLANRADVSVSMVEKMLNGTYMGAPREDARRRICRVVGIPEGELFPVTSEKKQAG